MTLSFRPASRSTATPLVGLYGQSGSGKTHSALMLARGFVGPSGKIGLIDTESGRGEIFADVLPGGYDVLQLEPPFNAGRYQDALRAAQSMDVIIIDSVSHEWEGVGGVLDQASEIEARTGKAGLHCWNKPKMAHQKFLLTILQSNVPVICCLRAKYKSRQGKNPRTGKAEIIKDDHTTPIQDEAFIYEMTVHAEILQDHTLRVTKLGHPGLRDVFQAGKMVSIATGEALRQWANSSAEEVVPSGGTSAGNKFDNSNLTDAQKGAVEVAKMGTAKLGSVWNNYNKEERTALGGKPFRDWLIEIAQTVDLDDTARFDKSGNLMTGMEGG